MTNFSNNKHDPDRFLRDRNRRIAEARTRETQGAITATHSNDVEEVISLDREANQIENQNAQYADPASGFQQRVRTAKAARRLARITLFTYAFIWAADFFLLTPDAAELLANKSASLVGNENLVATPVWLRVAVGIFLTSAFLLVTLWCKKLSDESEEKNAITNLPEGEGSDITFNQLKRRIFGKRAFKAAYMLTLAGLLAYLFSFDVARARVMQGIRVITEQIANQQVPNFRVDLTGSGSGSSVPVTSEPQTSASTEELSASTMAAPALVVSICLWLLHGALLLIPVMGDSEDRELAEFRLGRNQRRANRLRVEEERTSRSVYNRITGTPEGEFRQRLIEIALPIRDSINRSVGRTAMDAPAPPSVPPTQPENPPQNDNHRSTGDDDPYQNIFR